MAELRRAWAGKQLPPWPGTVLRLTHLLSWDAVRSPAATLARHLLGRAALRGGALSALMRRLHPAPVDDVTPADAYGEPRRARVSVPFVRLNMDGSRLRPASSRGTARRRCTGAFVGRRPV